MKIDHLKPSELLDMIKATAHQDDEWVWPVEELVKSGTFALKEALALAYHFGHQAGTISAKADTPAGDYKQLIEEANEYLRTSKEATGLPLNGDIENLAQVNIFTAINRYVYAFTGVSRQLEAVQNLIKKLRAMAVKLHGES